MTVIPWDPARAWRPGKQASFSREAPYLIGPPAASTVDPTLWGIGSRPCHQLVVKEASTRLTLLAAFSKRALLSPRSPAVPAIWEGGGRSLMSMGGKPLGQPAAHSDRTSPCSQASPGLQGDLPCHLHPCATSSGYRACQLPPRLCQRREMLPQTQQGSPRPAMGARGNAPDPAARHDGSTAGQGRL